MAIIPINISVNSSGVNVIPTQTFVPNGPASVQLQWVSGGGYNITAFSWKLGSNQPQVSPNSTNRVTSAAYTNNGGGGTWSYTITISNGTKTYTIDPEVDNEPPGPDPTP